MTPSQQRALDELMPIYGVPGDEALLDLSRLFGRSAPCHLEIGFGAGTALLQMAAAHPDENFLGVEVHRPGVGRVLHELHSAGLGNVRVSTQDAMEILRTRVAAASLASVMLYFPDPWHKKRHHKRRIVNAEFAALVARCLMPGGELLLATDWEEYAQAMVAVLNLEPGLRNRSATADYVPRPTGRALTRFEQRGVRLGHGVWDLAYERVSSSSSTPASVE